MTELRNNRPPAATPGNPRVVVWGAASPVGRAILAALHRAGLPCVAQLEPGELKPVADTIDEWRTWDAIDVLVVPAVPVPAEDEPTRHARIDGLIESKPSGISRIVLVSSIEADGPRSLAPDGPAGPPTPEGTHSREIEGRVVTLAREMGASSLVLRAGHLYDDQHAAGLSQVLDALYGLPPRWLIAHWQDRLLLPIHRDDVAAACVAAVHAGEGVLPLTPSPAPAIGALVQDLHSAFLQHGFRASLGGDPQDTPPSDAPVHYVADGASTWRTLGLAPAHTIAGDASALITSWRRERLTGPDGVPPMRHAEFWLRLREGDAAVRDRERGTVTFVDVENGNPWTFTIVDGRWWGEFPNPATASASRWRSVDRDDGANDLSWDELVELDKRTARLAGDLRGQREFMEEMVGLGLDDTQIRVVGNLASRHGLFVPLGPPA